MQHITIPIETQTNILVKTNQETPHLQAWEYSLTILLKMLQQQFYCIRLPYVKNNPVPCYQNHAGEFVITTAVSPEQAAVYAIVKRFKQYGDAFKKVTKYLHASFNLTDLVFNIDEADKSTRQLSLFEKSKQSHKRLDPIDIANKIATRYKVSNEDENSIPRKIAKDYIQYRRANPLTK